MVLSSSDISTRIAQSLIKKRGISSDEIDLIIIGTVTPDHFTPSTAALVQKNINATNNVGIDNGDAISEWKDLSGNGNHAIPGNAHASPTYSSLENGHVALDGTDYFRIPINDDLKLNTHNEDDFYVFMIYKTK